MWGDIKHVYSHVRDVVIWFNWDTIELQIMITILFLCFFFVIGVIVYWFYNVQYCLCHVSLHLYEVMYPVCLIFTLVQHFLWPESKEGGRDASRTLLLFLYLLTFNGHFEDNLSKEIFGHNQGTTKSLLYKFTVLEQIKCKNIMDSDLKQ